MGKTRTDRSRRGFTLIELMLVVAILAILAIIALPAMRAIVPTYRVNQAAKGLVSQMQLVRIRAISKNLRHRITFDSANQKVLVHELAVDGTATAIADMTIDLNVAGSEYPAVILGRHSSPPTPEGPYAGGADATTPAAFGSGFSNQVIFFSNGLTDESGEFFLIPSYDIASGETKNMRAVMVSKAGLVRKYRWKSAWEFY